MTPPQPRVHNLLEVENLRLGFNTFGTVHEVVKGVSFRIPPGKTVALVGESGSGKSVISQAIMGLLHRNGAILGGRIAYRDPRAPETSIELSALDPNGVAMRRLRGGRIGMIFQEPMSSLSPVHTIGDQIGEAFTLHTPGDPRNMRTVVTDMLDRVGFKNPDQAFDQYPFQLSGGLRQRAMLAMALICRPALLIADEPTTALDVTIQAQVLGLMRELQQDLGMAILLITHDLGVVANMADEIVVVYHGEVMEAGCAEDIFRRPRHPYLTSLFRALPHFEMREGERLQALREVQRPLAATPKAPAPATVDASIPPLLDVRNLSKSYGQLRGGLFRGRHGGQIMAVDDVSFSIAPGECLGLVGESGCGKTTLSKVIMRALSATSGTMTFRKGQEEIDIGALTGSALRDFRPRMQMIFQDPASSLSPRMTIRDILREPLDIHAVGDEASRDHTVKELMDSVGLDPRFLNRYPHSFSGGQRQRIGIARALAMSPDLVMCDEPVSALDVSVQAQVLNLLKDIAIERSLSFLFISHNLAVVKYMADRIAVMANGRIVESAPSRVLFERPVHAYTKALRLAVPYADLDRRMDFGALPTCGASDMTQWPRVFQDNGSPKDLCNIDLGDGHFVLANRDADHRELRP
jgi:peptide/nickel transport system ATP-binding protein